MKTKHLVPVAVLAAFPCLLLAANAATPPASTDNGQTAGHPRATLPLLAWADFDADGHNDAFAVHPDGTGVLYRGSASGALILVAEDIGFSGLPALLAASWEDANSDGLEDLLVIHAAGGARLYINDGAGFADATDASGLVLDGVLAARWDDHDGDGLPDLVTSSASGYRIHRNHGGGFFESTELAAPRAAESTGLHIPIESPETDLSVGRSEAPGTDGSSTSESSDATHSAGRGGPSGRRPVLPTDVSLAGGGIQPLFAPPAVFEAQPIPFCAMSMEDQASSACISASSTPVLGMLYPLSVDLNVASDGQVGIGTTNPLAKLDVLAEGGDRALKALALGDVTAAFISSGGSVEPALELRSDGFAATIDGRVEQGFLEFVGPLPFFRRRVVLDAEDGQHGRITVKDDLGQDAATLLANGSTSFGSALDLRNAAGTQTVRLGSTNQASAGFLALDRSSGQQTISLSGQDFLTPGSSIGMNSSAGVRTVELLSEEASGNGAQLALALADGTQSIILDAQFGSVGANLEMRNLAGVETVEIRAEEVAGNGAQIVLRKADGTASIVMDAEQGGDGRIITEVLEITGGADLVESFDTGGVICEPGSVVVIDCERPGELTLSSRAYDPRVAGVVSGAGGVRPGLHMGQTGVATGDTPVALTGRVYVRCTSENGPIRPGDLLTSSSTVGRAMRATDPERSFGTVIGKAMSSLAEGETGLVLVLVNLQ